jgi:hypothetical protein
MRESSQAAEGARVVVRVGGEAEDRLGVDGHPRLAAGAAVRGEQLVVVQDDPIVDADDRPVPDGVVVRGDRRVALGVVADMDEELGGRLGHVDALEELARRGALLRDDRIGVVGAAVGIADGVGAPLGDPGHQRLRRERPVDRAARGKAVSRDAAHGVLKELLGVDPRQLGREP